MGKKTFNKGLLYLALVLVLCTCNDPIFYEIAQEIEPIEPRIKGAPTNFACYDGRMFVASGGTLYTYNRGEEPNKAFWSTEKAPGGNIVQIAAAGDYLYALCATDRNNDGRSVIRRFDKNDSSWSQVDAAADFGKIHNIYSAGGILFAYASSSASGFYSISYTILYIDGSGTISQLEVTNADKNNTGELNGAAFDGEYYYLSTYGSGVYRATMDMSMYMAAELIPSNVGFTGIINLNDGNNTIFLIARNGDAYTVKDSVQKVDNINLDKMSSGALALWEQPGEPYNRLLLAGRQDSLTYTYTYGFSYGYLELELGPDGIKSERNFIEPGRNWISSVIPGENERFKSTIGKNPVNHLFQVPADIDSEMILFASTQKNGVWSYRNRGGTFQWNAEQ